MTWLRDESLKLGALPPNPRDFTLLRRDSWNRKSELRSPWRNPGP